MLVDVVPLPRELSPAHQVPQRSVVVFDVLRATTTMTAALAAGVEQIRVFDDIDSARRAAGQFSGPKLLCGESRCLPPPGFDLGNSPGAFGAEHAGRTAFMATTNGTRAIVAAQGARSIFAGCLLNASAVARLVAAAGLDVLLLAAGTQGQVAMEDLIGAGAVIEELQRLGPVQPASDLVLIARRLFESARTDLAGALRQAQGGRNVIDAGLAADLDFAARLNSVPLVGQARPDPLRIVRASSSPPPNSPPPPPRR